MSNHDPAELALSLLGDMSEADRARFLGEQLVKIPLLEPITAVHAQLVSHMNDLIVLRYSDDIVSAARSASGSEDAA